MSTVNRSFNEQIHFGRADEFEKDYKRLREKFIIKIIDDKIIRKQLMGLYKFLISASKYSGYELRFEEYAEDHAEFQNMVKAVAPNLENPALTEVATCLHALGLFFCLKKMELA